MAETFQPRKYQVEAHEAYRAYFANGGKKGAAVISATGTGKTLLAHNIAIQEHISKGERVFWLAGRKLLVEQSARDIPRFWPHVSAGIVQGKRRQVDAQFVYCSKDSLLSPEERAELLAHGYPGLIIVDEMHHSTSDTWREVIAGLSGPGTRLLGLTATPERNDNRNLSELWDVIYSFGILEAVECQALVSPFATFVPTPELDLSGVGIVRGQYDADQLEEALLAAHIVEHTVAAMSEEHEFEELPLRGRKTRTNPRDHSGLVYTATVRQAQMTAEALEKAGFSARAVWGTMPANDQRRLIAAFRAGQIKWLCNADLLIEGNDLTIAKVAVLACPLRSWTPFVQIAGRVLRPFPGYDKAYLLDLCGATVEHHIVAAAVLVDGQDCEKSTDGQHRYLQLPGSGQGACQDCGKTVPCVKSRTRQHSYKDGVCRHCGVTQCPEAPLGEHQWVPWDDGKKICQHCAMEIPDPMASLIARRPKERQEICWKMLDVRGLQVKGAHLGKVGILLSVRGETGVKPYLWKAGKLQPLITRPVSPEHANLLCQDVAVRAEKKAGYYGGQESAEAMRDACMLMEKIARNLHKQGRL